MHRAPFSSYHVLNHLIDHMEYLTVNALYTCNSCKFSKIVVKFRTVKFTNRFDREGAELSVISQTYVDLNADRCYVN